jgi:predicted ATP-grasp superfamily ATP-dependent carboligase
MTQANLVPSMFSSWRPESVRFPSSVENVKEYVTALIRHVKRKGYAAIFPLSDTSLLPISENRAQLTPYLNLVIPNHASLLKALDKSLTLRVAEEIGIPIPKTFHARNMADAINASAKIQYPAVIKPRNSYIWDRNGRASHVRPFYVNSASELLATYAKIEQDSPAPLIQEYVPGYNVSVALLFDSGEPKAACAIRVRRTIPVTGGSSVMRESIPLDPLSLGYASTLLGRLLWHGVAEVEFRIDPRDPTPKLMEINPRVWGSMNVAIESGVDFPYLMYLLAKGKRVNPVFKYKIGVKFRWLFGDTLNLISTLQGEPKLISVKPPNKFKAVMRFLQFYERDMHYDGLTFSDPLPFFVGDGLSIFGVVKAKALRKKPLQSILSPNNSLPLG